MLKLMKPRKYITTNVGNSFTQKIFEKSKDFFEYDKEEHELILAYMGVGKTSQEFDEILGLLRLLANLFADGFRKSDYRMSIHILNQMEFYLKNNYRLHTNQHLYQNMVQLYNDIVREIDSKEESEEEFINIQVQIQQQISEIQNYYNMQRTAADQSVKRNRPVKLMQGANHMTSYSVNAHMLRMLARNRQYMDVLVEAPAYRRLITDNVKQMSSKIMMHTWISMFLEKLNGEQKTALEEFVKEQNLFIRQRKKYSEDTEISIETLLKYADFKEIEGFFEALRQHSESENVKERMENVVLEKYRYAAEIDAASSEYQIREYINLVRKNKTLPEKEIQTLEEAWIEYKEEINQLQETEEILNGLRNGIIQEVRRYLETADENEKKDALELVQTDTVLLKRYTDYFINHYAGRSSQEFYQALSEYLENQDNKEFSEFIHMFFEKDASKVNKYLADCKQNIQMYYGQLAVMNRKENKAFVEQLINRIDIQPESMPWQIILEKDTVNNVFEEYMQDIKNAVNDWQDITYQNLYVQLQESVQDIFSEYQSGISEEYLNFIEKLEHLDTFGRMLSCYLYDKEIAEEALYTVLENSIKEHKAFYAIYKTISDKMLEITEKRRAQIITAYADYIAEHFDKQQEEILLLLNKTIEILPEPLGMDIDSVYMDKMSEVLQMQEFIKMTEQNTGDFAQAVYKLIECERIFSKHSIQETLYSFEPGFAVYKSEVQNQIEQMDKDMLSAFCEMIISTVREGQSEYTSSFITLAESLEKIYYGMDFQNNETDILNVQQAFKNYYQQDDIKDLSAVCQLFFGERSETREDIFNSFLNSISKYELTVLEELAVTFAKASEECEKLSERLLHTHQQYSKVIEKYMLNQPESIKPDFMNVLKEKLSEKQAVILSTQYLQVIDSYLNEWYHQTAVSNDMQRINQVSRVLVQQIVESMYNSTQKIDDFVNWYLDEPLLEHLKQFADDTQHSKDMEKLFTEISGKISFISKETSDGQIIEKRNREEVENILQSSELWQSYIADKLDTEFLKNRYCLRMTNLLEDKLQTEVFYQAKGQTYQYNYRIRKLLQEVMSVHEKMTSIKLQKLTDEVYNHIIQETEAVDVIRYLEKVQKIQEDMESYINKYILDVQLSDNNTIYELIRSSVYMAAVSEEQFMKMILTDTDAVDILKDMQDKKPAAKEEIAELVQGQPKLMVLREFSQKYGLEDQYRVLIHELNSMFRQYLLQTDKRIWTGKQTLDKFQKIMFESDLYTEYVRQIRKTQEYQVVCREAVKNISRQIYEQFITDEDFIYKIAKNLHNQENLLSSRMQETLIALVQKHIYYEKHKVSQIVQSIFAKNPVHEILDNLKNKADLEEYQLLEIVTNSLEENHNEYEIVHKNLKHLFFRHNTQEELKENYVITYEDFIEQLTQLILKNPIRNRYAEIGKSVELYKHYRDSIENSLEMESYSKTFMDMVYKSKRLYSAGDLLNDTVNQTLAVHNNQTAKDILEGQSVRDIYIKYLEYLTYKPVETLSEKVYNMQPGYALFKRNVYIKSYGKRNLRIVIPKLRQDEYEIKYDLLHLKESKNDLVYEIEEYQNVYPDGNNRNYQLNFALPVYDEKEYMPQEIDEQINSLKQQVQRASEEIENMKNIHIQMDKEFLHRSEKEVIERELIQKIDDDIIMAGKRHGIY